VQGADGAPVTVYGRLSDGQVIVGDGRGNRAIEAPGDLIARNTTRFAQSSMPDGTTVSIRRSDGSYQHDWSVQSHNVDGTVTVTSADGTLSKTINAGDLFSQNLHHAVGTDVVVRIAGPDGSVSDGWLPYSTQAGQVHVYRRNADGTTTTASTPSTTFQSLNADRILGAHGAYPGQNLRSSLGGAHATIDSAVVEGRDYRRVGAGVLGQSGGYLFRGGIETSYNGVTIRLEADPGMPTLDARAQIEQTMQAIDAVPIEIRRNITEVNVLEGRNPQDPHWAAETGDPNFRSGATAGTNAVNLYYGTQGDVPALFAHEATHTFGVDGGPFHRTDWEQAMSLDAGHLAQLGGRSKIRPIPYGMRLDTPAVSSYAQLQFDGKVDKVTGQRNIKEDWAETGGFIVQAERMGGIVATRRRWYGGTQKYTMADLFPNRTAAFEGYRQWARSQMMDGGSVRNPGVGTQAGPTAPGVAPASNSTAGARPAPSVSRRVFDHLLLSDQATIATNAAIQTQQMLDRNERATTEALAELDRLQEQIAAFMTAG
jgi:hypothetical protein